MLEFVREFQVKAPLDSVNTFHSSTSALKKLTPPPVIIQFHQLDELSNGATAKFTMWMGPLPINWTAFHIDVSENGFTDIQVQGPFKTWRHQHQFTAISTDKTFIRDHILAEYSDRFPTNLISRMMWWSLPLLFRYRQWQTTKSLRNLRK